MAESPRLRRRKKRSPSARGLVGSQSPSVPVLSTFASPRHTNTLPKSRPMHQSQPSTSAASIRHAGANATSSDYGNLGHLSDRGLRGVRGEQSGSSLERMLGTPPFTRRTDVEALSARSLHSARLMEPSSEPEPIPEETADNILSEAGTSSLRKKKHLGDKAFCVAKELLMTERTYLRDLLILTRDFRGAVTAVGGTPCRVLSDLFDALLPLADSHAALLADLESRLTAWENGERDEQRLGDLVLASVHNGLLHYQNYLHQLPIFLASVDELYRTGGEFARAYREVEARRSSYLPVSLLLLRPPHHLLAWHQLLTRLVAHYGDTGKGTSPEASECRVALEKLSVLVGNFRESLESVENFGKLIELERDLVGVSTLVQPNRKFLREGSLSRLSRKGPVQRLFLLFNDCLLYANRTSGAVSSSSGQLTFRLHGQIPLRGLMLEDGDPFRGAIGLAHCFTIYGGSRSLIVGANTAEEKETWMRELSEAATAARDSSLDLPPFSTLKPGSSLEEEGGIGGSETQRSEPRSPSVERSGTQSQVHHRANNTLHVCWHRCTTLGVGDMGKSGRSVLSGYLLRKFRNSTGWQKLWVVYAHFALFFYRSHSIPVLEDEAPLASLPLQGYAVSAPGKEDGIGKEHVFKLHYKSHFYFFRAESLYAYQRWMEVIRDGCCVRPPPSLPVSD